MIEFIYYSCSSALFFLFPVSLDIVKSAGKGALFTMIGGADHEDAIVILQAIDFVKEITAHFVRDQTV